MIKTLLIAALSQSPALAAASPICDHLAALDLRMSLISTNIANAETSRTPDGGPYKKQELVCGDDWNCGVVAHDAFREIYSPDHPDANDDGYVTMPDINT